MSIYIGGNDKKGSLLGRAVGTVSVIGLATTGAIAGAAMLGSRKKKQNQQILSNIQRELETTLRKTANATPDRTSPFFAKPPLTDAEADFATNFFRKPVQTSAELMSKNLSRLGNIGLNANITTRDLHLPPGFGTSLPKTILPSLKSIEYKLRNELIDVLGKNADPLETYSYLSELDFKFDEIAARAIDKPGAAAIIDTIKTRIHNLRDSIKDQTAYSGTKAGAKIDMKNIKSVANETVRDLEKLAPEIESTVIADLDSQAETLIKRLDNGEITEKQFSEQIRPINKQYNEVLIAADEARRTAEPLRTFINETFSDKKPFDVESSIQDDVRAKPALTKQEKWYTGPKKRMLQAIKKQQDSAIDKFDPSMSDPVSTLRKSNVLSRLRRNSIFRKTTKQGFSIDLGTGSQEEVSIFKNKALISTVQSSIRQSTKNLPEYMKNMLRIEHGGTQTSKGMVALYNSLERQSIDNVETAIITTIKKYTDAARNLGYKGAVETKLLPQNGELILALKINNQIIDMKFDVVAGGIVNRGQTQYYMPSFVKPLSKGTRQFQFWSASGYQQQLYGNLAEGIVEEMINAHPGEGRSSASRQLNRAYRTYRNYSIMADSYRPELASRVINIGFVKKYTKDPITRKANLSRIYRLEAAIRSLSDSKQWRNVTKAEKTEIDLKIASYRDQIANINYRLKDSPVSQGIGDVAVGKTMDISEMTGGPSTIHLYDSPGERAKKTVYFSGYSLSRAPVVEGSVTASSTPFGLLPTAIDNQVVKKLSFPMFESNRVFDARHSSSEPISTYNHAKLTQVNKWKNSSGRLRTPAGTQATIMHTLNKNSAITASVEGGVTLVREKHAKNLGYAKDLTFSLKDPRYTFTDEFIRKVRGHAMDIDVDFDMIVATDQNGKVVTLRRLLGRSVADMDSSVKITAFANKTNRFTITPSSETLRQFDKLTGKRMASIMPEEAFIGIGSILYDDTQLSDTVGKDLDKKINLATDKAQSKVLSRRSKSASMIAHVDRIQMSKNVGAGYMDQPVRGIIAKTASDVKSMLLEAIKKNPKKYLEDGHLKQKYIKTFELSINNFTNQLVGTTGHKYFTVDQAVTFNKEMIADFVEGRVRLTDAGILDVGVGMHEKSAATLARYSKNVNLQSPEFLNANRKRLETSVDPIMNSIKSDLASNRKYSVVWSSNDIENEINRVYERSVARLRNATEEQKDYLHKRVVELVTKSRIATGFVVAPTDARGRLYAPEAYVTREFSGVGAQYHKLAARASSFQDKITERGISKGVQMDLWKRIALRQKGMNSLDEFVGSYVELGIKGTAERLKALSPYFTAKDAITKEDFISQRIKMVSIDEAIKNISTTGVSSEKLVHQYRIKGASVDTPSYVYDKASGIFKTPENLGLGNARLGKVTASSLITLDEWNAYKQFVGKGISLPKEFHSVKVLKSVKPQKAHAFYIPNIDPKMLSNPMTLIEEVIGKEGRTHSQEYVVLDQMHKDIYRYFQAYKKYSQDPSTEGIALMGERFNSMISTISRSVFGGKLSIIGQGVHKTRVHGFKGVGAEAGFQLNHMKAESSARDPFYGMLKFNPGKDVPFLTPRAGENWLSRSFFVKNTASKLMRSGRYTRKEAYIKANKVADDVITGRKIIFGAGHRESAMTTDNLEGMRLRLFDDNAIDGRYDKRSFSGVHIRNMLSYYAQGGDTDADLYYWIHNLSDKKSSQEAARASYKALRIATYGDGKIDFIMSGSVVAKHAKAEIGKAGNVGALAENFAVTRLDELLGYDSGTSLYLKGGIETGPGMIKGSINQRLTDNLAFSRLRSRLGVSQEEGEKIIYEHTNSQNETLATIMDSHKSGIIDDAAFETKLNDFVAKNKISPRKVKLIRELSFKNKTTFTKFARSHAPELGEVPMDRILSTIQGKTDLYLWSQNYSLGTAARGLQTRATGKIDVSGILDLIKPSSSSDVRAISESHRSLISNYLNEKIMTPAAWKETRQILLGNEMVYGVGGSKQNLRIYNAVERYHGIIQQDSMSAKHAIPLIFDSWRTAHRNLSGTTVGFGNYTARDIINVTRTVRKTLREAGTLNAGRSAIDQLAANASTQEMATLIRNSYQNMMGDYFMDANISFRPHNFHKTLKGAGYNINKGEDSLVDHLRWLRIQADTLGNDELTKMDYYNRAKKLGASMESSRITYYGHTTLDELKSRADKESTVAGKMKTYIDGILESEEYVKSGTDRRNVGLSLRLLQLHRDTKLGSYRSPSSAYYELSHAMEGIIHTKSGAIDDEILTALAGKTGLGSGSQLIAQTLHMSNIDMKNLIQSQRKYNEGIAKKFSSNRASAIDIVSQKADFLERQGAPSILSDISAVIGRKTSALSSQWATRIAESISGNGLLKQTPFVGRVAEKVPSMLGNLKGKINERVGESRNGSIGLGAGLGIALGAYLFAQALRGSPAPELGYAPGRGGEYWEHQKRKRDEDSFNPLKQKLVSGNAVINRILANNIGSKNAYVSMDRLGYKYGTANETLRRNMTLRANNAPEFFGSANLESRIYSRALAL